NVREAARRCGEPIAVLGDLGGPKIRLGQIGAVNGLDGLPIDIGEELAIQREPIVGANRRVSTTFPQLIEDVKVGDRVLIEDGFLRFICVDKGRDELRCRCTAGGIIKSTKGINLPNTTVNAPAITDRDWECIDWAIENDLDYLGLSFVRKADEIHVVREHL